MAFFDRFFKRSQQASNNTSVDPNYNVSMQLFTPGQPVWSDKNYLSFVKEGYRKNPVVYAAINKISGAAGGIKWRLYTDSDKKREKTKDHPLLTLWNNPNPNIRGASSLVEQIFGFWHMSGNSYLWAYRPSPESPPLALWHLRPDRVKAVAGNNRVEDYVYGYGTNNPQIYSVADVMHLKFPAYDDDIYGLSPIEVASYYVDQVNESMAWNTSLMQNMGRPASVFMSKNYLNIEQRNQIRQELKRKYSGKVNAGMPMILEADMTWQNMSLKPQELDWLESRELNSRDIASIFDIASELIGDSKNKTFSNMKEANQNLYTGNVLPKMDRLEDYANSWLMPMYPDLANGNAYLGYDREDIEALSELIQAAKDSKADRAREDWLAGGMTLDEYRDAIGLKPAAYGAIYRIGAILVTEESLEVYADKSIQAPALPPTGVPEAPTIVDADPHTALPPATPPPVPATTKKSMDKHGIYQPDDLLVQLAKLKAKGITHIEWICVKLPCDTCQQNNGVVREVGKAFPSGHLFVPAHPNCDCSIREAPMEKTYSDIEQKFREYLEGSKNHAIIRQINNSGIPLQTAQVSGNTNRTLVQLSSMPTEAIQDGQEGVVSKGYENIPDRTNKLSRSEYRAFIERLT